MIEKLRLKQELNKLEVKELLFLNKNIYEGNIKLKLQEKIPENLEETLNNAFVKAFEFIFNKATNVIEKSFDKEKINLEFETSKFMLDYKDSDKNIKNLDKYPKKTNLVNNLVTTSVGTGLGVLGLGVPDIPLFVATILRGIYQISLSYGYDYKKEEEKIYILRLIRIALSKSSKEKKMYNDELKDINSYKVRVEDEIRITAQIMANSLLIEKFIQGIPVVGVVGGIVNNSIYSKITKFCMIKYKKRYIKSVLDKNKN